MSNNSDLIDYVSAVNDLNSAISANIDSLPLHVRVDIIEAMTYDFMDSIVDFMD